MQNSFGRENFIGLSIYTEENQGKTEKVADKSLANYSSVAKFTKVFYHRSFLLYSTLGTFMSPDIQIGYNVKKTK